MLKLVRQRLGLVLKGMAMGIAEVIPGVSGGTIAFITGIYEELIDTIKSLDGELLKLLASLKFRRLFEHLNGKFLVFLLIGMAAGIVTGIFGVGHLQEQYPEELWGFFFGLIIASAWYVGKDVTRWDLRAVIILIAGAAGAYLVTAMSPAAGSENLGYVFLCGMLAISALILPGISGSFILLLLGMYTVVIHTLRDLLVDFNVAGLTLIAVFAAGCLTGLITTARVLSWFFHNKRNATLTFLTGIMLGSLNKIWPWRNPLSWLTEDGNIVTSDPMQPDAKVLSEINVLPGHYTVDDPNTGVVVGCMILGVAVVLLLDRFTQQKPE